MTQNVYGSFQISQAYTTPGTLHRALSFESNDDGVFLIKKNGLRVARPSEVWSIVHRALTDLGGRVDSLDDLFGYLRNILRVYIPKKWILAIFRKRPKLDRLPETPRQASRNVPGSNRYATPRSTSRSNGFGTPKTTSRRRKTPFTPLTPYMQQGLERSLARELKDDADQRVVMERSMSKQRDVMERSMRNFFLENSKMHSERRLREEQARRRICGPIYEEDADLTTALFPNSDEAPSSPLPVKSDEDVDPDETEIDSKPAARADKDDYSEDDSEDHSNDNFKDDADAEDVDPDEIDIDSKPAARADKDDYSEDDSEDHSNDNFKEGAVAEDVDPDDIDIDSKPAARADKDGNSEDQFENYSNDGSKDAADADTDADADAAYMHCRNAMKDLSANVDCDNNNEDADLLKEEQKSHPCATCGEPIPGDAGYCSCGGARAMPEGGEEGWNNTALSGFIERAEQQWECPKCILLNPKTAKQCKYCNPSSSPTPAPPAPTAGLFTFGFSDGSNAGLPTPPEPTMVPSGLLAGPLSFGSGDQNMGALAPPGPTATPTAGFFSPGTGSFSFETTQAQLFDFSMPTASGSFNSGVNGFNSAPESSSDTGVPPSIPAAAGFAPWLPLIDVDDLAVGDPILVDGEPAVFLGMSRRRMHVRMENGTIKYISSFSSVQVRRWEE